MAKNKKKQIIQLSASFRIESRSSLTKLLNNLSKGLVDIDCNNLTLKCKDLIQINKILEEEKFRLSCIQSCNLQTIVSASSLGFASHLNIRDLTESKIPPPSNSHPIKEAHQHLIHEGTLRSGEVLEAEDNLLIIGDVNPGAIAAAGGNVMIWGRLLGIAHAGKHGNSHAKITALQLRPLQLRIANKIARGPSEKPELGLAEEAKIENGNIVIKPASPR